VSGGWFLISSFSYRIRWYLGLSPYHILYALLQWFIGITTIARAHGYHAVTMLLFYRLLDLTQEYCLDS